MIPPENGPPICTCPRPTPVSSNGWTWCLKCKAILTIRY